MDDNPYEAPSAPVVATDVDLRKVAILHNKLLKYLGFQLGMWVLTALLQVVTNGVAIRALSQWFPPRASAVLHLIGLAIYSVCLYPFTSRRQANCWSGPSRPRWGPSISLQKPSWKAKPCC